MMPKSSLCTISTYKDIFWDEDGIDDNNKIVKIPLVHCGHCDAKVAMTDKFCPKCGAKFVKEIHRD